MIRRRVLMALVVLIPAAVMAYGIRDDIHVMVVLPVAYIWWVIGLYYRLIPQVVLWIGLIILVLIAAVSTLLFKPPLPIETPRKRESFRGPIESLSTLLEKRNRGIYYRWLIAHRLGRLAHGWLNQQEGILNGRRNKGFADRAWKAPREVNDYLETGLNGSFADFPRSRWMSPKPNPLDEPPLDVIAYLESEMGRDQHGNR